MLITQRFLDDVGRRSPMARAAMAQAGDKIRIKAMINVLVTSGACEIKYEEAEALKLPVYEKKYSFLAEPLVYVLLNAVDFARFKPLNNSIALEVAHIRNGLIGIRKRLNDD